MLEIASSLSPFCAEITHPAAVKCGTSARVAGSVCWAFVARMIVSHSPDSVCGVNAGARCVNSAIGPVMRSPERLMASTCSSTESTKVTSWPARARCAPIVPPIAPAPHTRNLIEGMLRVAPGARKQAARLIHGDLPERGHLFVRPLVHAAVVAIAQVAAQCDGVEQSHLRQIDHLPLRGGERHAGQSCPGEVLHPR